MEPVTSDNIVFNGTTASAIRTTLPSGTIAISNILDQYTGESVQYIKVDDPTGITPDGEVYIGTNDPTYGQEVWEYAFDRDKPKILTLNSVEDLRNLNRTQLLLISIGYYNCLETLGYYAPNDGGGAKYSSKVVSGAIDDGFSIIIPTLSVVPDLIFEQCIEGIINVLTSGARSLSGFDSRSHIQACLDYIIARGGRKKLLFPKGVYYINSFHPDYEETPTCGLIFESGTSSTTANSVILEGEGNSSVIRAGVMMSNLLYFPTDTSYFKANQMVFDGAGFAATGLLSGGAFHNAAFYECMFSNCRLDGIYINTWVTLFSHCRAQANGRYGFRFGNQNTSTVMLNCYAVDNGQRASEQHAGYLFENARYTSLISCASDRSNTGYRFNNVESVGMYNCGGEGDSRCVLVQSGDGFSVDNFYFMGVTLPTGANMADYLFHFINTSNVVVRGYHESALPTPPLVSRVGISNASTLTSLDGSLTYADVTGAGIFRDLSKLIGAGSAASRPTTDLFNGRLYYNTTSPVLEAYHASSSSWMPVTPTATLARQGTVLMSAASANTATPVGAVYSQTEVQAILTELRDLKAKMRAAGLMDS